MPAHRSHRGPRSPPGRGRRGLELPAPAKARPRHTVARGQERGLGGESAPRPPSARPEPGPGAPGGRAGGGRVLRRRGHTGGGGVDVRGKPFRKAWQRVQSREHIQALWPTKCLFSGDLFEGNQPNAKCTNFPLRSITFFRIAKKKKKQEPPKPLNVLGNQLQPHCEKFELQKKTKVC